MGKQQGKNKAKIDQKSTPDATAKSPLTLSDLRQNNNLWYKILVLIYDFQHQKDAVSKRRMDATIDAIYISMPYFTPEEADTIKSTLVDDSTTIEAAIHATLGSFTDKREASGDYRPCGPHDMVPAFLSCFGIDKAEIADAKFVSRVARSGLEIG
jgi:hypothetical protein